MWIEMTFYVNKILYWLDPIQIILIPLEFSEFGTTGMQVALLFENILMEEKTHQHLMEVNSMGIHCTYPFFCRALKVALETNWLLL